METVPTEFHCRASAQQAQVSPIAPGFEVTSQKTRGNLAPHHRFAHTKLWALLHGRGQTESDPNKQIL